MQISKKRKVIVAISFVILMAFSVVMINSFNASTPTEVLAAETHERAVNLAGGDSDNRNWVNDFGIFNNERWHSVSELQTRFPQSQSDFDGRFVTIGSWSMFNVNGFDNLEIHLVNTSIRFAINEDDMDDFFGSHIVQEESRAFLVTNHTTRVNAHGYIPSPSDSTVYIIDNPQGTNQNSILTISVPRSAVWLFDSVNITVENGNVEIADAIEEFLTENFTVNGNVVRVSDSDIVRFAPITRTNTQTNTQTNTNAQQRPNESTTDFGGLNRDSEIMLVSFPQRFPNVNIPSNSRIINFNGGWSNGISNLEVNLLNADLRIIPLEEGMIFWGFHRPNTPRSVVVEGNNRTTAHILHRGTAYIWDNEVAYDGLVTIHIPLNAGWIFDNANIHLENGHLEIDESAKGFLAENLNISIGSENVSAIATISPQPNQGSQPVVSDWQNAKELAIDYVANSTNIQPPFTVYFNGLIVENGVVFFSVRVESNSDVYEIRIDVATGDIIQFAPLLETPSPVSPTPSVPLPSISQTEAIRIARNHIGLPLEGGASSSMNILVEHGNKIFHFWINGVTNNPSYEFRIDAVTGEILEFTEGSSPPSIGLIPTLPYHNESNRPTNPPISQNMALEIGGSYIGSRPVNVLSPTMEWENNRWVWFVWLAHAENNWENHVLFIDVITGEIVNHASGYEALNLLRYGLSN